MGRSIALTVVEGKKYEGKRQFSLMGSVPEYDGSDEMIGVSIPCNASGNPETTVFKSGKKKGEKVMWANMFVWNKSNKKSSNKRGGLKD